MIEPSVYPFGAPYKLEGEQWESWSRIRGVRKDGFRCQLCQHEFKEGDFMTATFSNVSPHRGGNPLTCGSCATISYEDRLRIWDRLGEPRTIESVCLELGIEHMPTPTAPNKGDVK
jgi:hypothetical protein